MNLKEQIDFVYEKGIKAVFYLFLPFVLPLNFFSVSLILFFPSGLSDHYLFYQTLYVFSGFAICFSAVVLLYDFIIIICLSSEKSEGKKRRYGYLILYAKTQKEKVLCGVWAFLLVFYSFTSNLLFFYDKTRMIWIWHGEILYLKMFHETFLPIFMTASVLYYAMICHKIFGKRRFPNPV